MSVPSRCERCGNALPPGNALAGQCPRCLLEAGLPRDEAGHTRLVPGAQLGPYEILGPLGAGGMGEVYRGRDSRLDRIVAIKLVHSQLADRADLRQRFEREARALAQLNHPNICTIHDVGADFLVMEWLDGQTLKDKIATGPLDVDEALEIVLQVARGLEAAHERGILHRDIKPANIMVVPTGQAKLMDFGLAKFKEAAAGEGDSTGTLGLTDVGVAIGTPSYMSPEQARGGLADPRADIWSLGVVLYEVLTGRRPFAGESGLIILRSILDDEPARPSALRESLPAVLDQIVSKVLAKDPSARYQCVHDLLVDLQGIRERKVLPSARQSGSSKTNPAYGNSARTVQPRLILGVVAMVLAGLAVAYWVASRSRPSALGTLPRIEALAVLPLTNLSGDAAQEYFAEGMTDALTNDLAQIGALRVISRYSAMQFKGTKKALPQIAQQLNVDAVVGGSVLRSGNRVRITAELIQASTDRHLWAGTYERNLGDILDLQNEVALAIVREIQTKLTPREQGRLARNRTVNPAAYEAYLRGRIYWDTYSAESLLKSIEYFEQAIKLDPGYAAANAGLATSWGALEYSGAATREEARPKALEAASKALAMDDSVAEAHVAIAMVRAVEWDWAAAEAEIKKALQLNPGSAQAHLSYSNQLRHRGRREESIAEAKRAQELDPLSPMTNEVVANAYVGARQFGLAIEHYQRTLQLDPNRSNTHYLLGWAYSYNGMHDKGVEEIQRSLTLDGVDPSLSADLAYIYAVLGNKSKAHKILERLQNQSKLPVPPEHFVLIYTGLGDEDEVFVWLEKAYQQHSGMMTWLKVDPRFDRLRPDARFQELMRRVGLI